MSYISLFYIICNLLFKLTVSNKLQFNKKHAILNLTYYHFSTSKLWLRFIYKNGTCRHPMCIKN